MGIVIEIDAAELLREMEFQSEIAEVCYRTTNRMRMNLGEIRNEPVTQRTIKECIRTKSLQWSYEEEVRLILRNEANFEQGHLDLPFNPACIKRVIVGVKAAEVVISQLQQLRQQSDYSHVAWEKAGIHVNEYELTFSQI